jgi:DNA polymerase II small subunit/DNA polymerase delta subunit B
MGRKVNMINHRTWQEFRQTTPRTLLVLEIREELPNFVSISSQGK